jgi:hypothetical protein
MITSDCAVSQLGLLGNAMIAKPTKIQAKNHIQYLWTAQSIPLHCRISLGEHTLCRKVQFITHCFFSLHSCAFCTNDQSLHVTYKFVNLTTKFVSLHHHPMPSWASIWSLHVSTLSESCNKNRLSSPTVKLSMHLISSCYFVLILWWKLSLFTRYPMPNRASIWKQHYTILSFCNCWLKMPWKHIPIWQQQHCTTIPVLLQLFATIKPWEKHYPMCSKKRSINKKLD